MAQPIVQSFVVDTAESEQNLKNLNTQVNATADAVDNGAQSLNNVAKAENAVTDATKSLKEQLSALQKEFNQVAATDPGGARYKQLAKQIADVKQQISDAATAVSNEGVPAFQGFSANIGDAKDKLFALDFKGATESFKGLASNISNFKVKDFTEGLSNIKTGFINIGKALLANPLFLVAGAIAAAVAYREELFALVDGISSADQ